MTNELVPMNRLASGTLKFSDRITFDDLQKLVEEGFIEKFRDFPCEFQEFSIRENSTDTYSIEFKYRHNGEKSHKQFVFKLTDMLKRRFGNDLVGWDISSTTWCVGSLRINGVPLVTRTEPARFGDLEEGEMFIDYPNDDATLARPYQVFKKLPRDGHWIAEGGSSTDGAPNAGSLVIRVQV